MPPTAIIADDEPQLRAFLRRRLAECWPDLVITAEAANGEEALLAIEESRPDVAFLDIQMPVLSGLEVAARLSLPPKLVFVTAYDQYAIEAFDSAAIDYLLKPVSIARLTRTVERLRSPARSATAGDVTAMVRELAERLRPTRQFAQWLQASTKLGIVMVPVAEIVCFQAADKYTLVLTTEQEYLIRTSLKELESTLEPEAFWRVHRNAIVAVAAIDRISRDFRGNLLVHLRNSDRRIAVGRNYVSRFKPL